MGRVYAVASAKGGVGKTTTTASLGVALAAAGHRVAVVDADVGMPNLGRMLGVSPDGPTLHDVLADEADPLDAVYEGPHGVRVVPGSTTLDSYRKADPRKLRTVVRALDDYDIVLVDTGAGLSHDTVLPLGFADAVLLVSTPSPDALGDTDKTRQLAERVDVPIVGLVLTRVDTTRVDVDAITADFPVDLIEVVPEDSSLDDASTGDGSRTTDEADSPAAAAYRALAGALAADAMNEAFDEAAVAAAVDAEPAATDDENDSADVDENDSADVDENDSATDDEGDEAADSYESDADVEEEDDASDLDEDDDRDDGENGDDGAGEDDSNVLETILAHADEDTDENEADASSSDSVSDSGLASTLADVESADETTASTDSDSAREDADDVSAVSAAVADAVTEAEPDADEGVTFDTAPDAGDESGVTIQPDDAPGIPDAEADRSDAVSDRSDQPDTSSATNDSEEGASEPNSGPDDADEDTSDGERKKGLFGRFFG